MTTAMITDVSEYFAKGCGRCARFGTADCSVQLWSEGLAALRALCLEAGLVETAKWGHPSYMHAGRNIAIIGAFRGDFVLNFFNAALMTDPEGVLVAQGPNTRHAGTMRFGSAAEVTAQAAMIRAYLVEAMGNADAGSLPPKDTHMPEMPEELTEALDADPELAEAFAALTPGRQKSYVINLNGAKQSQTRMARIVRFRDRILAGKGAQER